MTALQFDNPGVGVDPIWVGMERPVVHEQHHLTHRYPESLVPVQRVRVDGFTVTLGLQMSSDPESAALGRRLFEQVCDAIKDVIRSGQTVPAHGDESHDGDATESSAA